MPWLALCALIEPFYLKPGNGRPPVERVLRIYFVQHWFNLSDPAVEEALYDSQAMRRFVGIDLGREPVPDVTTVCRFLHLLEAHDLGRRLFDEVQRHPAAKGLKKYSNIKRYPGCGSNYLVPNLQQLSDDAVREMSHNVNLCGASPKSAEILQSRTIADRKVYLVKLVFPRGDFASLLKARSPASIS